MLAAFIVNLLHQGPNRTKVAPNKTNSLTRYRTQYARHTKLTSKKLVPTTRSRNFDAYPTVLCLGIVYEP